MLYCEISYYYYYYYYYDYYYYYYFYIHSDGDTQEYESLLINNKQKIMNIKINETILNKCYVVWGNPLFRVCDLNPNPILSQCAVYLFVTVNKELYLLRPDFAMISL